MSDTTRAGQNDAAAHESAQRLMNGDRIERGSGTLVLSVAEAAEALGVSDDLVYELIQHGELPCLHLRRRKVIPRCAIELVIERAMDGFDPGAILVALGRQAVAARNGGHS